MLQLFLANIQSFFLIATLLHQEMNRRNTPKKEAVLNLLSNSKKSIESGRY